MYNITQVKTGCVSYIFVFTYILQINTTCITGLYHYAVISPCCKLVAIFVSHVWCLPMITGQNNIRHMPQFFVFFVLFCKICFPQCSFKYKSPYSILGPIRFKAWLGNTGKKYRPGPFFDFFLVFRRLKFNGTDISSDYILEGVQLRHLLLLNNNTNSSVNDWHLNVIYTYRSQRESHVLYFEENLLYIRQFTIIAPIPRILSMVIKWCPKK